MPNANVADNVDDLRRVAVDNGNVNQNFQHQNGSYLAVVDRNFLNECAARFNTNRPSDILIVTTKLLEKEQNYMNKAFSNIKIIYDDTGCKTGHAFARVASMLTRLRINHILITSNVSNDTVLNIASSRWLIRLKFFTNYTRLVLN
ncbi:hypothetical protein A3Q56_08307 [Intoshia linei]|uniref:Uncharacterized protein n=1 Tax=Intoshia linei TaxID=1819745 RepID=A0A177AQB2_9BILA|nr:hypothetical protein A3Q56_08307 [Intoshia linei]